MVSACLVLRFYDLFLRGKRIHFQARTKCPKLPSLHGTAPPPQASGQGQLKLHSAPELLGKILFYQSLTSQSKILWESISIPYHKHKLLDNMSGLKPTLSKRLLFHPSLYLALSAF